MFVKSIDSLTAAALLRSMDYCEASNAGMIVGKSQARDQLVVGKASIVSATAVTPRTNVHRRPIVLMWQL